MTVIEEGALRFEFGANWTVFQLDDHASYRNGIGKLKDAKSIDFLGLHAGILYLIEVKDFRHYRIQNKHRLKSGDLAIEFAQKVKDSLASLLASHRNPTYSALYAPYFATLTHNCIIRSVLWLEQDLKSRATLSAQLNLCKKQLNWLGGRSYVMLSNLQNNILPETHVTNLPRPL